MLRTQLQVLKKAHRAVAAALRTTRHQLEQK